MLKAFDLMRVQDGFPSFFRCHQSEQQWSAAQPTFRHRQPNQDQLGHSHLKRSQPLYGRHGHYGWHACGGNTTGSATGAGAMFVNAGTLGGSGIIAGAVTIAAETGADAFLAREHGTNKQLTLTIRSSVTCNSDATYTYTFKAKGGKSKTDKVVAKGVTINSGASFNLSGSAQGTLTQGTVLRVIKNTAASPISGSFSNLPEGAIVNVNGNNLQASYSGGDGNDLTLTVVP